MFYHTPIDCIVASNNGITYIWNGRDNPQRWDTINALTSAGVVAQSTALTLSGSSTGNIVGRFYGFTRWKDDQGNYSNLSPISNLYEPAVVTATVKYASFESPIKITTTAAHGLTTGWTVKIKGVVGNTAANCITTVTVLTTTTFTLDNTVPNGAYVGGGTVETGVGTITYTGIVNPYTANTNARALTVQILRNKDGAVGTLYVDTEYTYDSTSSKTSTKTSAQLTDPVSILDTQGFDLAVSRYGVPPDYKAFSAVYLGRMFSAGEYQYSEGCITAPYGESDTYQFVAGSGILYWGSQFVGRQLEVTTSSATTTQTITGSGILLTSGSHISDPFASYVVRNDLSERRTIYFSEAGLPEAWPATNSFILPEDPGSGEITGLMVMNSWMYILAEARVYTFSYQNNPLQDGFNSIAAKRGCVNNRCWVQVEGSAYMLDYLGVHLFAGNYSDSISTEIQDLFKQKPLGKYRINWKASRYFHAVVDPSEETIRWFVCLNSHYLPQHAMCFQYKLKRWWIEEYSMPIGASCLGYIDGRPQVFLGTDAKRVLALNGGTLDGPDANTGTVRGTPTSAGRTWLADTSAVFPTTGLVGFPLVITGGMGKGQRRTIASVSGTTIYVTQPWTTKPDTTSTYQIGGIQWTWRSQWLRLQESEGESKGTRTVALHFKPTVNAAQMDLKVYRDLSSSPQTWGRAGTPADRSGIAPLSSGATELSIQTTKTNGYVRQELGGSSDRTIDGPKFLSVELVGCQNTEQQRIFSLTFDGGGEG